MAGHAEARNADHVPKSSDAQISHHEPVTSVTVAFGPSWRDKGNVIMIDEASES